jgi:hypothetical protein
MKMMRQLERARRAMWVVRQPLTRQPTSLGLPVSDLFVWRNGGDWRTSFELIDIPGLFGEGGARERHARFFFFDRNGKKFLEQRLPVLQHQRQTIDLSTYLAASPDEFGTFSVFHDETPQMVSGMGSFIAERGYVSYQYRNAPLRAYVHGNLDAVSLAAGDRLEMLGAASFLPREYRLQYELKGGAAYEFGLVNPSAQTRSFSCTILDSRSGDRISRLTAKLPPGGLRVLPIELEAGRTARAVIGSRLVMARPLVFHIHNQRMDVFHG